MNDYGKKKFVITKKQIEETKKEIASGNYKKVNIGKYNNLYNPFNVFVLRKYLTYYDIIHVHLWPAQLYISLGKVLSHSHAKFITTE